MVDVVFLERNKYCKCDPRRKPLSHLLAEIGCIRTYYVLKSIVLVCVCRTGRQRAASVRPGRDGCVEVGGDGAEPRTADNGQPQQGEGFNLPSG